VNYLKSEQTVVNLNQSESLIEEERLTLPAWINGIFEAWLVVPLLQQDQLYGFIVLTKSRADLELNWENMDLLITTGREACNHLALLSASEKLSESRQFEAFNRLSAYVVHDLKNIVAQLNLLVKNADKHKDNPEFISDAFETVKNSVNKMSRMLLQLQKSKTGEDLIKRTDLNQALISAIKNQAHNLPGVQWQEPQEQLYVLADGDRLTAVLQHLIQNAQEATADNGRILINVKDKEQDCVVDIQDTGVGMDKDFLENRLFKPFDTTKGNAGMGIGVYESRETLRSFGGDLLVSSEVGQGTTFSLVLKKYSERMLDD
jgi:putative PEP-CTERM system histidine kinase